MRWLGAIAITLFICVGAAAEYRIARIQSRLEYLIREEEMTRFTTTWETAEGERSVTTTCRENETLQECIDRHDDEVTAAQVKWPPL